ncbi:response regulator transcription factor [Oscillospiraceae bacterium 21-37]
MIYCVEDDESILRLELYTLRSAGFDAEGFPDGESFLEALRSEKPELVLLDIMLPGESGVELLRHMRESRDTTDIPIIMATAKGGEYDKIESLDMGADDYLVKPYGMMEMVSRVKAVLRRYRPLKKPEVLRAGKVALNSVERIVTVRGQRVELTFKEFELLRLFLSSPGIAFTREDILARVWDMEYTGETRTVDMHIKTLRQKLGEAGALIKTVRNVGYRLEAPK